MIKLTIEDLQEIADFKVIERPLIQKPLIAESDVVTIDNNLSTYVTGTQKRELTVNLGYLDREGYEILRGFRDRQYENLKYPKASITTDIDIAPDGQIIESDITKSFNLTTNDNPLGVKSVELVKIGDNEDYIFEDNGRFYVHKATAKIASYNGETITTDHISTTGGLTTGATVYYVLATPVEYEITKDTLVELRYARTYVGQTNVWTESNGVDLPVKLDYSYRKEGAYLPVQITDSTYANLTDTLDAPLDVTKLGGDTFQQTYSGKNLMPYPYDGGGYGNGITFTANSDGSVTLNGKNNNSGNSSYRLQANITLQAGTYYFIVPSNTDVMFSAYDGSRYYDIHSANNYTLTLSAATTLQYIIVQVARGKTSQFSNYVVYPMMTTISGQTAADYEPYVGGSASPSPDYPQTVQTVTGVQKIEVVGKNLFDKDNANTLGAYIGGGTPHAVVMDGSNVSVYIPCQPNTTYTISKVADNVFRAGTTAQTPASGVVVNDYVDNASGTSMTLISSSNAKYIVVFLRNVASTHTQDELLASLQIEHSSTATTYESYKTQEYEVNLGKNILRPYAQLGTIDSAGLKATLHADGSITINGTATAECYVEFGYQFYNGTSRQSTPLYPLSPKETYCLSSTYTGTITGGSNTPKVYAQYNSSYSEVSANFGSSVNITNSNGVYRSWLRIFNGTTFANVTIYPMLEHGSTATDWKPYFTPIELCKIGDYQDYIYKSDEDWYLRKVVRHITASPANMNNSETHPGWTNISEIRTDFGANKNGAAASFSDCYCNVCLPNAINGCHIAINTNASNSLVFIVSSGITQTAWKTDYADEQIEIYYGIINAPSDTKITDENLIAQLEDLWSTYGFSEYTTISTSADDTGNAKPVLEATQGDITGKGTDYTLEETKKMPMEYKVYGQAIQNGAPSTSTPIPIETVKGNNSITFTGPSGRKEYSIVGKMTLADQRIIDNCGTAEQVQVVFRESKQI